jgi:hypothetical protein
VVSVLWAIGAAFWTWSTYYKQAIRSAYSMYRLCETNNDIFMPGPDYEELVTHNMASCQSFKRPHFANRWDDALGVGLFPIPLGWLAGWFLVRLGRWIRRRFLAS